MRRGTMTLALVLAMGASSMAGQAPLSSPATPAEAPRTTAEDLKKLVAEKKAVVVDVRGKEAWDAEHIEGALHIPYAELSARMKDLPKDKNVVAYCT